MTEEQEAQDNEKDLQFGAIWETNKFDLPSFF